MKKTGPAPLAERAADIDDQHADEGEAFDMKGFDFSFLGVDDAVESGSMESGESTTEGDTETIEQMFASMSVEDMIFVADDYVDGDASAPEVEEPYRPSISEGDFEDPAQRVIFKHLRETVRRACNINSGNEERKTALEWVFVPSTKDRSKMDFDTACTALGARGIVVRARAMHRLWEAGVIIQDPLPFLAVLAPSAILNEIGVMLGDDLHTAIARQVWNWPSIHVEVLRSMFPEVKADVYSKTMNDLEAHGYIGLNAARVYFISRNPALLGKERRANWQFAGSIMGDY